MGRQAAMNQKLTPWCTECQQMWTSSKRTCGEAHAGFVKRVESIDLSEMDEEMILDAIQMEKSITWRQALKLVEKLQDTRAESAARDDERNSLETRERRWRRSFEAVAGDPLGSRSPEEALSSLVDMWSPNDVRHFFKSRERPGKEDERAFLTDEEQAQINVVAILKELARARRLLFELFLNDKLDIAATTYVRDAIEGLFEELRVANIALLAQAAQTEKLSADKQETAKKPETILEPLIVLRHRNRLK